MQGGIRRKHDLLPRYKVNGNNGKSYLTTPMKKIIVYILLLITVFTVIHTLELTKTQEDIEYELTHSSTLLNNLSGSESQRDTHANEMKILKDQFNNDVAMQQEIVNLENDIGTNPLKTKTGNKVKAIKQSETGYPTDHKVKMINNAPYEKPINKH